MKHCFGIIILVCIFFSCCNGRTEGVHATSMEILGSEDVSYENVAVRSDWEPVGTRGMFRDASPQGQDFSFQWLRWECKVDNPGSIYGVVATNVYFAYWIYINGRLIVKQDQGECRNINGIVNFRVPAGVLKLGKNTIYVRLGIYRNMYSPAISNILLLPKKEYAAGITKAEFFFYELPLGMIFFLLSQCVVFLILHFHEKRELVNLLAAGACAASIVYFIAYFIPVVPIGLGTRLVIINQLYLWFPLLLCLLVQSYFNVYFVKLNYCAVLILILASVIQIMFYLFGASMSGSQVQCLVVFSAGMIAVAFVLYHANLIRPDTFAFYPFMIICIAIPLLFWISEIINYISEWNIFAFKSIVLAPLVLYVLMILLIRKLIRKKYHMGHVFNNLVNSMQARKKTTVSVTAQQKINEITRFLENNFKEDISREGLAATVDLSPDFLSRSFYALTGKKISRFINELRIKEAITFLQNTDMKIIDIAFNVGFESLTTFNRIFNEITKQRPSDFRKNLTSEPTA